MILKYIRVQKIKILFLTKDYDNDKLVLDCMTDGSGNDHMKYNP